MTHSTASHTPIIYLRDHWEKLHRWIDEMAPTAIFVLTDAHTREHCLPLFKEKFNPYFKTITIPAGEQHKTLNTAGEIWQFLIDCHADRHALLINLGGGVITDIGAFCADTYQRGISYIQMPTSILAMTDAAIGGKTGVNFSHFKNYIGTFSRAAGVAIDTQFLHTLPDSEKINGMGEIIKHGLIIGGALWDSLLLKPRIDEINWEELLRLSIEVKLDIVTRDFKESGIRKVLNLGHTFGHAFETFTLRHSETPMSHGEAVAHGLLCMVILSEYRLGLPKSMGSEIKEVVQKYFRIRTFDSIHLRDLYRIMGKDKKNAQGDVLCILLRQIGLPEWDISISFEDFEKIMTPLIKV